MRPRRRWPTGGPARSPPASAAWSSWPGPSPGDFRILLLDEPSSGLDGNETERFGEILRAVVARRGTGILLVEHDMALVMEVCDYIYVLDFGQPIFEGTPAEVRSSDVVRAAYLGSEAVEAVVG